MHAFTTLIYACIHNSDLCISRHLLLLKNALDCFGTMRYASTGQTRLKDTLGVCR